MRFHVPSLPHTQTTRAYDWCAYTAKVRRFATMMRRRGHEVFLYSGEENEAECTEHVVVVSDDDQQVWDEAFFEEPDKAWMPEAEWWSKTNLVTAGEIARRAEPGDFLCCIVGTAQQPIAQLLPELTAVEYGIGYYGMFAQWRAYESRSHRAYCHGLLHGAGGNMGRWFDEVIPNSYDPEEYLVAESRESYLLYCGRIIPNKGIQIAVEVAKATGRELVVAGYGDTSLAPDATHLGVVTGPAKATLIAKAHAVLVPSLYLEPFGGIAVEAMMSGVPAITSDWGAFPETVPDCYRARTLSEFVGAVEHPGAFGSAGLRRWAESKFSTEVVSEQYEEWFERVDTAVHGAGWYEGVNGVNV